MLLGQSLFQSVLTRLEDERQEADDAPPEDADFRIRGLGAGFVMPAGRPLDIRADGSAYFDHDAEDLDRPPGDEQPQPMEGPAQTDVPEPQPADIMPAQLQRLTEAEIAEDLALSPNDDEAVLQDRRRQFARLNHPDRVAPQFRDQATTRMKIANQLIDRAITQLPSRHGRHPM
ncbi:hypothetical protein ACQKKX_02540 [Neorhizobium sp. NPDC001467]|uniref:hypothetical protein n=1 Tax=Neorhizobium sp. NPDC001467 TaxID=3390595 RepID=UPI003CFF92F3